MMKHVLKVIAGGIFLAVLNSPAQITVLESTTSEIRLKWELDSVDTVVLRNGVDRAISLSFKGQNITIGENGDPALPGYSLFAGVPPQGSIAVSLIPENVMTIALTASPVIQTYPKGEIRQPGLEFRSPWISEPMFTQLKGIRCVNLVLRPVVYDKQQDLLRVMKSGTIVISLPSYPLRFSSTPATDGEKMVASMLCNYTVARGWREENKLKKSSSLVYPLEHAEKVYHFVIGDGHSGFNEGSIDENGLMKIPGSVIVAQFGTTLVSQARLFASHKGELPDSVPMATTISSGLVEIPLLRVDKNHNGYFDNDDYCIAYVTGASDWVFKNNQYEMVIDRYDDYRHYWMTTGGVGASMLTYTTDLVARETLTVFQDRVFLKQSLENPTDTEGSLHWIWAKLNRGRPNLALQLPFTGLIPTLPGTITISFGRNNATLNVIAGDTTLTRCDSDEKYTVPGWNSRQLTIAMTEGSDKGYIELDHVVYTYYRNMDLRESSSFTVQSPEDAGVYSYKLQGGNGDEVIIVRVSNRDRDISLVEKIRMDSGSVITWTDSGSHGARYLIYKESALLSLPVHQEYQQAPHVPHSIHDLRNTANRTDYLIITHRDFITAAESLAVHKEKVGFTNPAVVEVSDIYRLFGGGDRDPSAIRNFVSYINAYWSGGGDLDYVVLMGSAHYDVKQYKAVRPSYVPTSYWLGDRARDDFFGEILRDSVQMKVTLAVGRIPCKTPGDAIAVVRKIRELEDATVADFSDWRNRALFIADDDMQGDIPDVIATMTPHHVSSDRTSDALMNTWKSLDLRKVFLYEYEWNNAGEKPGATRAIINEINSGVAFVNFFGHGSDNTWADEHVLVLNDIQQMVNRGRYPLISSFSCSVGRFDQPNTVCLSEGLVTTDRNGAIATVSSSRTSFANSNEALAVNFYRQLADTGETLQSIGMMLTKAKMESNNEYNRTYVLLGDPSIKFQKSVRKVNLEIVDQNNQPLQELKALQLVKIRGNVLKSDGSIDNSYGVSSNAFVSMGLFNPQDTTSRKDNGANFVKYVMPGTPVFQGKTAVTNGHFEQTVLLPRNVAFNKQGVKLIAYSWKDNAGDAGSGFRNDYVFNGSDAVSTDDTTGPSITIRPVYDSENMNAVSVSFSDRITSILPLKCELDLYDPSGIDVVGTGPDEGLTMKLDGVLSKRSINHKFQFKEGDFRKGTATLEFDEKSLKTGTYTLTVTARDLLGFMSERTFNIEIVDEQDLKLDHVFNFPNPVRIGQNTRFYFYPSNTMQQWTSDRIRVVVKIYTLSGKLIRVIKDANNGVIWDCKDQSGATLSPDIYLYQVHAYSAQKKILVKSKVRKLVIHPPR